MAEVYYTILIKNLDADLEDIVSGICFEYGASGVAQNLKFQQSGDHYEPVTEDEPIIELNVYFESPPPEVFQSEVLQIAPKVQFSIFEEQNKDWLEEWKKGFVEFEIIPDVWVVPSWRTPPATASSVIRIDPGMAFGTGTHETTKLASQLILDLIRSEQPQSMIDVGTGTGLLALLAEHLGVETIQATEIEEMARQVAKENVVINRSSQVLIRDDQIEDVNESFDLVVANIIDGVLVDIQEPLKRCLAKGGHLLLTGILEERELGFKEKFQLPSGYVWSRRLQLGEWVGLVGAPG